MTDHRISLTLYKLDMIMDGDIGDMVDALRSEYQAGRWRHGWQPNPCGEWIGWDE